MWMASDLLNHPYFVVASIKAFNNGFQRVLLSAWKRWEGGVPREGKEAPDPFPHTFSCASLPSGYLKKKKPTQ